MNVALFTMHSERNRALWEITLPNKTEYCDRQKYELVLDPCSFVVPPGWERLSSIQALLISGKYEWVWWLGSDCLITNLTTRLEPLMEGAPALVLAYDAQQNQGDSILFRACEQSVHLLQRMQNKFAVLKNHVWAEQQALEDLIPEFREHIKIVPQRSMNSFEYNNYLCLGGKYAERQDAFGNDGNWQPGDFVFHCPGLPMWRKAELLEQHVPLIVR